MDSFPNRDDCLRHIRRTRSATRGPIPPRALHEARQRIARDLSLIANPDVRAHALRMLDETLPARADEQPHETLRNGLTALLEYVEANTR